MPYLCGFWRFANAYLLKVKKGANHGKEDCVNALSGLYLISTQYTDKYVDKMWLECQCPLGLIPHFYRFCRQIHFRNCYTVSMPSRAYTSFLQYPFKNLGFMRFPEPVFAGIYQNILTTAVFRAC